MTVGWTIAKASLIVTANNSTITYGEAPANADVTYKGFVGGENKSVLDGVIAYHYSYSQYGNVGTYTITPSGVTSGNYDITFGNGTLTVKQKEIGITWNTDEFTYDAQSHKPTATATGLVNGDKCDITVIGEATNAGSYTATASALSNGNYKLPAAVTKTFEIKKASLTVTAKDASIVFGAIPVDNGVTYAGFVGGETEAVLTGTLVYNINCKQYDNVGGYTITPKGLSSGNYDMTFTAGNLSVTAKEVAITIDSLDSVKDEALKELTYQITSGEFYGEDAQSVTLTKADGTNAGTYAITGTCSDSNYAVTFTNGIYTILQKVVDDGANSTGIEIIAENGLDPDTKLVVTVVANEDFKEVDLKSAVGGNREIGKVFEITLESEGVKTQPNGMIKIRLPIPDDMKDDKNLSVVYIDTDGNATNMNATRDGDYLTFEVDHLSTYAIVGTGNLATVLTIIIIASVLVLGGGFCVYWFVIRKKKKTA